MKTTPTQLTLAGLFLIFSLPLFSQDITGALTGQLIDQENNPIEGATVVLSGNNIIGSRGTVTDRSGNFRFYALPVGRYDVKIEHVSFNDVNYQSVNINLGKTTGLGQIKAASKEILLEEVTYTWQEPVINNTTHTMGNNLKPDFFEALPTERDYLSVTNLLPRVNESYYGDGLNMTGGTGSDNAFYIDGVNVTDPFNSETATKLPFNFVREIQVMQNGFEAQYGKSMGGIVNVITYSGTNTFEADAFAFLTSEALTADPVIEDVNRKESGFLKYDAGLSIKGPAVKDKLWYNVSYNFVNATMDVAVENFETRTDRLTSHIFAAKLNWNALGNTAFDLSVFGDPTKHDRVGETFTIMIGELQNIDPILSTVNKGGVNFSLNAKNQVKDNLYVEGQVYYTNNKFLEEGTTPVAKNEPNYYDAVSNIISGGYGINFNYNTNRIGIRLKSTYNLNDHEVTGGVELEQNSTDYNSNFAEPGWINALPEIYGVLTYESNNTTKNTIPTLFLQDNWTISNRINLNYGVRWEGQFMRGPVDTVKISLADQWQPRLGLIYNPGKINSNKLYVTYGRFYAQYPTLFTSATDKFAPYDQAFLFYSEDPRLPGSVPVDSMTMVFATKDKVAGVYGGEKLKGEFADEFTLGYDRSINDNYLLSIKAIHRKTKNAIVNFMDTATLVGNPGRGILSHIPSIKHQYQALELSGSKIKGDHFTFMASYVLSQTKGNYNGFYDQLFERSIPGQNIQMETSDQIHNSDGLLPNDRTHQVKITANYKFDFGLSLGGFFSYYSGSPINEFGPSEFGFGRHTYLVKKGSAGRLPDVWDLNLRLLYHLKMKNSRARIFMDVYHLGNPRKVTKTYQVMYTGYLVDDQGAPIRNEFGQPVPDPETREQDYGKAMAFQPPTRIRFGLEVMFGK
jgi:hypothetical protein